MLISTIFDFDAYLSSTRPRKKHLYYLYADLQKAADNHVRLLFLYSQ